MHRLKLCWRESQLVMKPVGETKFIELRGGRSGGEHGRYVV